MEETIISLIGSLAGTFAGIVASGRLTGYRIEQLEKKVEKHNSLVERTYSLERQLSILDTRIDAIEHEVQTTIK